MVERAELQQHPSAPYCIQQDDSAAGKAAEIRAVGYRVPLPLFSPHTTPISFSSNLIPPRLNILAKRVTEEGRRRFYSASRFAYVLKTMTAESRTGFKLVFLSVMLGKCSLNVTGFPQTFPPAAWISLLSINFLQWLALVCSTISHALRTRTSAAYLSGFLWLDPWGLQAPDEFLGAPHKILGTKTAVVPLVWGSCACCYYACFLFHSRQPPAAGERQLQKAKRKQMRRSVAGYPYRHPRFCLLLCAFCLDAAVLIDRPRRKHL